ncbi:hypothetical protein THA_922 [Thermosipho africanus TCF52B]|uniref:Uncharacterized protein n=1 Tax=Thermosipho africanus (strain TCF52B) TaxID=484019 RepID=B7IH17_THEAB|nr:hypothetical protein THA_922 [Thermosipho africanus TCF52B]
MRLKAELKRIKIFSSYFPPSFFFFGKYYNISKKFFEQ